jgi:phosphatidylserine synthase
MNWRVYQRLLELTAVVAMMIGIVLMWMHLDPRHGWVYMGFALLAIGKLVESLNVHDPSFRIIRIAMCVSILLLVGYSQIYQVRSMVYILVPLGIYYLLHFRWVTEQKKL